MMEGLNGIYRDKTVLITGDTGFKGSWLAIWLLHLGAKVVGFALPPRTDRDNFVVSGLDERVVHVDGDIRDYRALLDVFNRHRPDFAFHLAAQPLVLESYLDPMLTFSTNVMGTVHFLEAVCATPSVLSAIVVTSDKCYANRESEDGYREIDPLGGKDPYSASKAACEMVASSYLHLNEERGAAVNIASVRAGNVLGGGDWQIDRIFPDCMRAFEEDRPVVLRHPDSIRPWQHVLDPLCGYLELGARLITEGREYTGAWNFGPGPGNMVSVRRLVEEIIALRRNGEYVTAAISPDAYHEAKLLYLDISKATGRLAWRPRLDIKATVAGALEEYAVDEMEAAEVFGQRIEHIHGYEEMTKK
jgi:CDP-glucose 4,6-dehydratase